MLCLLLRRLMVTNAKNTLLDAGATALDGYCAARLSPESSLAGERTQAYGRETGRLRAHLRALPGADRALRLRPQVRAVERRRAGLLFGQERRPAGAEGRIPPAEIAQR